MISLKEQAGLVATNNPKRPAASISLKSVSLHWQAARYAISSSSNTELLVSDTRPSTSIQRLGSRRYSNARIGVGFGPLAAVSSTRSRSSRESGESLDFMTCDANEKKPSRARRRSISEAFA